MSTSMARASASGTAGDCEPPGQALDGRIRAQIAAIDNAPGPLRTRVAQAAGQIIDLVMPRESSAAGRRTGRRHVQGESVLSACSKRRGAPRATVEEAQCIVLGEFTRHLLETDFRRRMAAAEARPFSYLVECVKNQAVELLRIDHTLRRRHERAASDTAVAPGPTTAIDDDLIEREQLAEAIGDIARVPRALGELDRDELLLLLLGAVLQLERREISEIMGTTTQAVRQRLHRLLKRLFAQIKTGCSRPPDPGRSRGGKASVMSRAARRGGGRAERGGGGDASQDPDLPRFPGEDSQIRE
jgi:RNA polymerase sigma factor (sigma-70 family)